MSGFHFSKVPKFKIRRGGIVEDVSLSHLASPTISGSGPTVLQEPETVVGTLHILPAPDVRADISSRRILLDTGLIPEMLGRRQKGNQRSRVGNKRPRRSSPPLLVGLDPSVVEKLPSAVALAATSVHKYWTSSFEKAVDTAEVTELMKLAEMYTSCSHVLNCELYKILEMKVDEIHSALGDDEDVEAMRAEINRLRA
ncbi:hypothetical protein Fot_31917 [Forsythia ovata]|uniref:Uncharacterized protein n=1 Tax=Forsythia ovata TaxID=205694 RepID=A0ABD1T6E4_9LAMI